MAINGHAFGCIDEPLALYRWRADSLARDGTSDILRPESLLRVYGTLLRDEAARPRLRTADRAVIDEQIAALHGALAYGYRKMGRAGLARGHAIERIRATPSKSAPYVEWLKTLFPRHSG